MRLNNCWPPPHTGLGEDFRGGGGIFGGVGGGGRKLCNQSCDGHHTLYCLHASICSSLL